jgi:hypothetical protein
MNMKVFLEMQKQKSSSWNTVHSTVHDIVACRAVARRHAEVKKKKRGILFSARYAKK